MSYWLFSTAINVLQWTTEKKCLRIFITNLKLNYNCKIKITIIYHFLLKKTITFIVIEITTAIYAILLLLLLAYVKYQI